MSPRPFPAIVVFFSSIFEPSTLSCPIKPATLRCVDIIGYVDEARRNRHEGRQIAKLEISDLELHTRGYLGRCDTLKKTLCNLR